jgi:hypothetical protein
MTRNTETRPTATGKIIFILLIGYEPEAQWAEPVSLTFHSALRKLNTEPSIGASHQILVHFGKAVSEKIFRNRPI